MSIADLYAEYFRWADLRLRAIRRGQEAAADAASENCHHYWALIQADLYGSGKNPRTNRDAADTPMVAGPPQRGSSPA